MIRNKALDFIIRKVQWGEVKAGSVFYSEKELAIKLNISVTTAKNALNFAESIRLLKAQRGTRRVVEDFTRNVYLTKYLTLPREEIKFVRTRDYNASDKRILANHFHHPIVASFKTKLIWRRAVVASFYSSTPHNGLYESIESANGSFLDFLRINQVIIEKIEKHTSYSNRRIVVKRLLLDKQNQLIEEGVFFIRPKYFLRKMVMHFFSSHGDQ